MGFIKRSSLALAFLCSGLVSCQEEEGVQPRDIPLVVREALLKAYPLASNIVWEKQEANYEAEFNIRTKEGYSTLQDCAALLEPNGNIIMEKKEISPSTLPITVKASIDTQFKGAFVEEAAHVLKANVLLYQVELETGKAEYKLAFSTEGDVVTAHTYWD